ncbi:SpoVT / AbrB like domain protein [compost metagenome]
MKEFSKKIGKSGSITLPAALRRQYGLTEGERFRVIVDNEDGTILLQRTEGSCLFCKSSIELIVYYGRFVCTTCIGNMDNEASEARFAGALLGGAAE